MKRFIFAAIFALFMAPLACAQETNDAIMLVGTIADNNTIYNYKDDIGNYLATYTKENALKPEAVQSGYSIVYENGYMKFDDASNAKIVEFLKKTNSTLQVTVKVLLGKDESDLLSLVSIENK
ncbi:MAG: hypothetical protein PHW54_03625 [Candidatus Omnitrophica bacterium]|nr:hypothetical protein [Candidatus Omnitrophota bacterium]